MPVILPVDRLEAWLDPSPREARAWDGLLVPYPAEAMMLDPVSPRVNKVGVDELACIAPVADTAARQQTLIPR